MHRLTAARPLFINNVKIPRVQLNYISYLFRGNGLDGSPSNFEKARVVVQNSSHLYPALKTRVHYLSLFYRYLRPI